MDSVAVVFVHLGAAHAAHLEENLIRVNKLFPEIRPILIYDDKRQVERFRASGADFVSWQYDRDLVPRPFPEMQWDPSFRGGFWRFTTERFFALEQWHKENPQRAFLHVESDIVLLPNFPFDKFSGRKQISWQVVSGDHDVSSLLYSPTSSESEWLADQVYRRLEADPMLNDMTLLSLIRKSSPQRVGVLPSWAKEWRASGEGLNVVDDSNYFGGIFDGLTIGYWFTGQDPRNNFGRVKYHEDFPQSLTDTSSLVFRATNDGNLLAARNGVTYPIYCLHVHSKDLSLFRPSESPSRLQLLCGLAADKAVTLKGFNLKAFWKGSSPLFKELFKPKNYLKLALKIIGADYKNV